MKTLTLISALALSCTVAFGAEGTVSITPTTQRYLGDESEFAREKFTNVHSLFDKNDAEFKKFKEDYNIDSDYIGSRRFFYPISNTKGGNIPSVEKKYSGVRDVQEYIATSSPSALFYDKSFNYATTDFMPYIRKVAKYVADSYSYEWDDVPHYLEPFNEPMIHAKDIVGIKGDDRTAAIEEVITYICKYHKEIAREVKSRPELANIEIMGFGSAFPELESNNFGIWNDRFKQFIDIAGEDIDILSIHLYDGNGVNNTGGRRTGSNLEAIIDILQTYTFIKQGAPMPIAITEYGRLVPNQPEWEAATGAVGNKLDKPVTTKLSNYSPVTNSQAVRSQLNMVMAFMNRQNELVQTVPFTIGKAPQSALYCKSSLWVQQEDGSYEYSNRRYFFEMLKDIEGEQVAVKSDNVDIQALGYVDDNKLYIMLNNLYDETATVKLDLHPAGKLKSVSVKTLKIFNEEVPQFDVTEMKSAPSEITLQYGETAVITYEYKSDIEFKREVERVKYYSKVYLQPIESNKSINFPFEGVESGAEDVTLRLGVGRKHGVAVEPSEVKVNGVAVALDKDLIKGYDQNTRKQFFGALEIAVPAKLLKSGQNNVSVTYAEGDGYAASAILQVEQKR